MEETNEHRLKGTWGEVPISAHPKRREVEKLLRRVRDNLLPLPEALAIVYGWHMDGRLTDDRFRRLAYELSGLMFTERNILFRKGSQIEAVLARRIARATGVSVGSRQFVSELVVFMHITSDHARDIQNYLQP